MNAASFYYPLLYSRTFLYPQGRLTVRIVLQRSLLLALSKLLSRVLSVFLTGNSLKITVNFRSRRPKEFCKKKCSWKFHKIHLKTTVPKYLF